MVDKKPLVLTLHEFTSFSRNRRAILGAFVANSAAICLTTNYETKEFLRQFPRAKSIVRTIPIGSNIPSAEISSSFDNTPHKIVYFGQVKPGKGLEEFVALARIATAQRRPWIFRIVGAPVDWAPQYLNALKVDLAGCQVEWILNPSDDEAANALADSHVAYLPYPDGLSERRTSFLAALCNGVPVVTTDGPGRPQGVDDVVLFAEDPAKADEAIFNVLQNKNSWEKFSVAGRNFAAKYDWSQIAQQYRDVYEECITR